MTAPSRHPLWARVLEATHERPFLALAPMEGISDAIVRDLLSALGGMDLAVTEFIRVVHRPVSRSVLLRECPELIRHGTTPSGVPVAVQLLGGEPEQVAASARTAAELGAPCIDLNFGCPAKKVNGSDGGAALLKTPHRVADVVAVARRAVPEHLPVSAKIRLGWDDPDRVDDLVRAAESGGASWITIHGRTKVQMYSATADWERIARARSLVRVPVIANGDIFTPADLERCRATTGATAFMLGRGAFRRPNLFRWMRRLDREPWAAPRAAELLIEFVERVRRDARLSDPDRCALNRLKGWLRALAEAYEPYVPVFHTLKRAQDLDEALALLRAAFELEHTRAA